MNKENASLVAAAIREDRTRGGRSTYQCTYALPGGGSSTPEASGAGGGGILGGSGASAASLGLGVGVSKLALNST